MLIEKKGRRGIVLCPDGRFMRVVVPHGVEVGEDLPIKPPAAWRRTLITAAASLFIVCGLLMVDLTTRAQSPYALVTLDFDRTAIHPSNPPQRSEKKDASITLALDKGGTVKAVDTQEEGADMEGTDMLVGLQLEQALDRTVKLLVSYGEDQANLRIRLRPCRPLRDNVIGDTEELENRIRNAVQDYAAQVAVEVGPPVDQGELERDHQGFTNQEWQ